MVAAAAGGSRYHARTAADRCAGQCSFAAAPSSLFVTLKLGNFLAPRDGRPYDHLAGSRGLENARH
jgi:hypothetical protein